MTLEQLQKLKVQNPARYQQYLKKVEEVRLDNGFLIGSEWYERLTAELGPLSAMSTTERHFAYKFLQAARRVAGMPPLDKEHA